MTFFMALLLLAGSASFADVYVEGYTRQDGTYVRPHIRSNPNQFKWDNYGPSDNSSELMNPRARDADNDGMPNFRDRDDDNDGLADDYDRRQYDTDSLYDREELGGQELE